MLWKGHDAGPEMVSVGDARRGCSREHGTGRGSRVGHHCRWGCGWETSSGDPCSALAVPTWDCFHGHCWPCWQPESWICLAVDAVRSRCFFWLSWAKLAAGGGSAAAGFAGEKVHCQWTWSSAVGCHGMVPIGWHGEAQEKGSSGLSAQWPLTLLVGGLGAAPRRTHLLPPAVV